MTIAKNETSEPLSVCGVLALGMFGLVMGIINIIFVVFDYLSSYDGVIVFGVAQTITAADLMFLSSFWFLGFNVKGADWESRPMRDLAFVSALLAGFAAQRALVLDIWLWWVPFAHLGLFLASIGIANLYWYRDRFDPYKRAREN